MSLLLAITITFLVLMIVYQVGQASEYASRLNNTEEESQRSVNKIMQYLLPVMFLIGLYGLYECHEYLMPMMLPKSASIQGEAYDTQYNITTILTLIVFFITQTLLFWFTYKYAATSKDKKAYFIAHNNKLEILWTTIPAAVLAILIVFGLRTWVTMTGKAPENAAVVEIVGKQFNWVVRYPGKDKTFGKRNFRDINDATNILGMNPNDPASKDDIVVQNGEMHLVVGKPVKLIIGSRDVIHSVGLPHFRMKMDAVPGITTTIWFTPTITSEEMKKITNNPDFVYEICCDQMCGKGHYSMRGTIIVESQKDYNKWMIKQQKYFSTVDKSPSNDSTQETKPLATK